MLTQQYTYLCQDERRVVFVVLQSKWRDTRDLLIHLLRKVMNGYLHILSHLVIVAEVTQPSLGVGYELGRAVAMGKRILCLYRPQENKRKSYSCFLTKKNNMSAK